MSALSFSKLYIIHDDYANLTIVKENGKYLYKHLIIICMHLLYVILKYKILTDNIRIEKCSINLLLLRISFSRQSQSTPAIRCVFQLWLFLISIKTTILS